MTSLAEFVRKELCKPVPAEVRAFAAHVAARHGGAAAILFYGSCLRETRLDGLMLDLYLLVETYDAAYDKAWLAAANKRIPPNVFYAEHEGLAAKYAVLSLADFARQCRGDTRSVSVWARFAQPSRLVWSAGQDADAAVSEAIETAAPTLLRAARPMLPDRLSIRDLWVEAFALTYAAELRAERKSRGMELFDYAPDYYRAITAPALEAAGLDAVTAADTVSFQDRPDRRAAERAWKRWRRDGKLISLARLAKASLTFAGGIDYLAWKINRHAGTNVTITPWQRRHPIIAGLMLVPRLIKQGAIK